MILTARQEANFWAKVEKTDMCWNWTGAKDQKGYGRINVTTDGIPFIHRAHRVSYHLMVGPIIDGFFIDHVCHNKSCVNPDHLRQVTPKQNLENHEGATSASSTGIRGVFWHKENKCWRARVTHFGKLFNVGVYPTIQEAEAAVIAKRNELYTHNDIDRAGQVKSRNIPDTVIAKHGIKVGGRASPRSGKGESP